MTAGSGLLGGSWRRRTSVGVWVLAACTPASVSLGDDDQITLEATESTGQASGETEVGALTGDEDGGGRAVGLWRRGSASLLGQLELSLTDPVTVEIEVTDARGTAISLAASLPEEPPGPIALRFWWPLEAIPVTVTVRMSDGDRVLDEERLEELPDVPIAARSCDPHGFENRCADGMVCVADEVTFDVGVGQGTPIPDPVPEGICQTVAVTAWSQGTAVAWDLRTPGGIDGHVGSFGMPQGDRFETARPAAYLDPDRTWRATASLPMPNGTTATLYVGPHRLAAGVVLSTPLPRDAGESCDPRRLADHCVEGTVCGPDQRCE